MIREADVSQRESNLQNTAAIIAFIQEPQEFGRFVWLASVGTTYIESYDENTDMIMYRQCFA